MEQYHFWLNTGFEPEVLLCVLENNIHPGEMIHVDGNPYTDKPKGYYLPSYMLFSFRNSLIKNLKKSGKWDTLDSLELKVRDEKVNFVKYRNHYLLNFLKSFLSMAETDKPTLKETLDKLACYNANVTEFLADFNEQYVDANTGQLKPLKFDVIRDALQDLWNKIKETSLECEGKEINIQITGEGPAVFLLQAIIAGLGFEL